MEKPTLQQIADMPHTLAVNAMREHYDPQWPMVTEDPETIVECDHCGAEHPLKDTTADAMYGDVCPTCIEQIRDWNDE